MTEIYKCFRFLRVRRLLVAAHRQLHVADAHLLDRFFAVVAVRVGEVDPQADLEADRLGGGHEHFGSEVLARVQLAEVAFV